MRVPLQVIKLGVKKLEEGAKEFTWTSRGGNTLSMKPALTQDGVRVIDMEYKE
jgi:hypothetical protein